MGTLQAYNFLIKAAGMQERRKELFSRAEISKRINEIKYLSAQKKIPKLSLRKEIVHLEQQLQKLSRLEEDMAKEKRKESARVTFLKKQNQFLKQRLAATADKDMGHKVEKISYLLSECLAKQQTNEDVEFAQHLLKAAERIGLNGLKEKTEAQQKINHEKIDKFKQRLEMLKQELAVSKSIGTKNPEKIALIESKIEEFEEKISTIYAAFYQRPKGTEAQSSEIISGDIKHEFLYNLPDKTILSPAEESFGLPLPPPPKRIVK